MSTKKNQRLSRLRQMLMDRGSERVSQLAQDIGVTPETIRKDLDELEKSGVIVRQHGQARIVSGVNELPFLVRGPENLENKRRVALRAMQEVQDGDVIWLDSGTTMIQGLPVLANKKDLTIVTNCIPTAYQCGLLNMKVIFAGGPLTNIGLRTMGQDCIDLIDRCRFDVALIGTDGFKQGQGFSACEYHEVAIKRHVLANSHRIIAVTDRSKFDNKPIFTIGRFSEFDMLVTNPLTAEEKKIVADIPIVIEV